MACGPFSKKSSRTISRTLNPDVLVLEETKLSEDLHLDFPFMPKGYFPYWTVSAKREKAIRASQSFAKVEATLNVTYGLKEGKYDNEGRVITFEFPSFYFIGAYVPIRAKA
jgi:exodeoxyribonuclease-3